jgi:hypothetical protein
LAIAHGRWRTARQYIGSLPARLSAITGPIAQLEWCDLCANSQLLLTKPLIDKTHWLGTAPAMSTGLPSENMKFHLEEP